MIETLLISMKFVVFIKHYDLIWLEYVGEPCEKFDNDHNLVFFKAIMVSMWYITFKWKMTRNVRWTVLKSSISNVYWLINSNWKQV
jgi:hypothetical protein